MYKDFFGTPIRIGDKGVRVDVNAINYAPFKLFTVKKIKPDKRYDNIGILIDGGKRMSWVSDKCCIIQGSFNERVFSIGPYKDEAKEVIKNFE